MNKKPAKKGTRRAVKKLGEFQNAMARAYEKIEEGFLEGATRQLKKIAKSRRRS
jgi:hypothetical protein